MYSPVDFIKQDPDLVNHLRSNFAFLEDYSYTEIHDLDKNSASEVFVNYSNPHLYSQPVKTTKPKDIIQKFYTSFINEYNPFFGSDKKDASSELLFPGIRYLAPGIVVFERPPAHHVLSVSHDYRDSLKDETPNSTYYIPIPWQVYVCEYNPADMRLYSVKMFFTHSSLMSIDQPLYTPPMFNFYSDGSLCRPFFATSEDIEKYPQNVSGVIASAFDWVWNSGFNYDITDSINFFLGNTKGHLQFDQYITPQLRDTYDAFANTNFPPFASNISRTTSNIFLKLWECVPIEVVSNFQWNPVSPTQNFWFSLYRDSLDKMVEYYVKENNLTLIDSQCDHDCHCDDCCDEDEDVYECREYRDNPSDGVTYEYITENVNLTSYFSKVYCQSLDNTLPFVIQTAIKTLKDTNLISNKSSSSVFQSFHAKISSILS